MGKEYINIKMDLFTKEIGKIILDMGLEKLHFLIMMYTLEIGLMTKEMVLVNIYFKMEIDIKDSF